MRALVRRGRNELRRGKHERTTDQCDRNNRHHQGARRPHRAPEDLSRQVGQPRSSLFASLAVGQDSREDPGIEVGRRDRFRKGAQQLQQPGASTQFSSALRTSPNVVRQGSRAGLVEIVDEVGVDQLAGGMIGSVGPMKATHTI